MQLSPEDEAFRDEVRAFFAAELTPELRRAGKLMTSVYADHAAQMQWHRKLHARGWVAPAWPVEHGGCDWSIVRHHIFASERVRAGAPPVSPMGIQMAGPAIIAFGTEAQKAWFLPRMLSGEHFWCQGYSEPGAGSDLAALQMKAVRDGDDLVCTGSKIWVTHANVANWAFCLVRTSTGARKQQGISFLLVDMTSPGIAVRPIVMASGEHIQNQIFFDQVRVPVANVLGTIDDGWTVAKYLLEFERGGSAYAPKIEVALAELAAQVAAQPAGPGRAPLEVRIAEARIRCDILARLESDILSRLSAGASTGTDASMMKILGTELQQRVTELVLDAAGPLARAFQPGVAVPGGPIPGHVPDDYCSGEVWQAIAPLHYLNERASSIYAGTNEIQHGILAKAELAI
ncbi:acyl-CoA dehydrogenase family protein [Sphingopyxis sp. KK2]|uniref:acyl-CoA dehydrogenase family protein n=1 Tax=Sphingopyxis sp. KK2 TaxID=1855727 RepID=UPI00097E6A42|nr:acyl-CoA dehydrogenase family protein [Sphingopyxis sp. KK2]